MEDGNMTDRRARLDFISRHLGRRELIWAGLRADDIHAISDLPHLAGSFSIIGGHNRNGLMPSVEFEDLSGLRVDLDAWDIEEHLETEPAREFRHAVLNRLLGDTALLPYRPSRFLSSILFARQDRCLDLGLFGAHQQLFEYKPWVETNVAALGLPHVSWEYVADEELTRVRRCLSEGPIMLRVSGAGLVRVDDPGMLEESWPHRPEAFVAVSQFIEKAIPVNIGATVWRDGITMRHPSVQLIGIPECTTRPFGYCGNDFGLASELDNLTLDQLERSVVTLGQWLRSRNYLGTFGVDFLVDARGVPLFTEINPRFQGSTHASSQLSSEADESCLFLDHIAAVLGHDAPPSHSLKKIAHSVTPLAHIIIHWKGNPSQLDSAPLTSALRAQATHFRTDIATKLGVITDTGGVVARVTVRDRVTATGYELLDPWRTVVASWDKAKTNYIVSLPCGEKTHD